MRLRRRLRPPFSYWGGKHYAVPTLMRFVPDDVKTVLSPFIGGGSFEATLAAHGVHVQGGDIFDPVAHFWDRIVIDAEAVIDRILDLDRGMSKGRWNTLRRNILKYNPTTQAAALWLVANYSYAGTAFSGGGYFVHPHRRVATAVDHLRAFEPLPINVAPAGIDFERNLEYWAATQPDALAYCDPPYERMESMYGLKRSWAPVDLRRLRKLLKHFKRWIVTVDVTPTTRRIFRGAYVVPLAHFNPALSYRRGHRAQARDAVVMSPAVARAVPRLAPLQRFK